MKTYKVYFRHGHFIDLITEKRLILTQGEEYIISSTTDAFSFDDSKLNLETPLSSEKKLESIQNEYRGGEYKKILKSNDRLVFRLGNPKKAKGDHYHEYAFACTLLEDLYIYQKKGNKETFTSNWRLAKCRCVLDECLLGGLEVTEKIPAVSLNNLFSQTVMFYFNMQRTGSCNAFDTFYILNPNTQVTFDRFRNGLLVSIGSIRNQIVEELKKNSNK
jgi:hypothetical protein